jgi:phage shock protein PspC (stress-responsive transcriptional regulator)
MFAGVCGGLAEAYGADATAIRLLTVIFGVITGIFPVLFIYLIAAIVIPDRDAGDLAVGGASAPVIVTRRQGGLIAGLALVGFGIVALANEFLDVDWALLWPVALIVLGGAVIMAARR